MENGAARAFRARRFVTLINAPARQAIYGPRDTIRRIFRGKPNGKRTEKGG